MSAPCGYEYIRPPLSKNNLFNTGGKKKRKGGGGNRKRHNFKHRRTKKGRVNT